MNFRNLIALLAGTILLTILFSSFSLADTPYSDEFCMADDDCTVLETIYGAGVYYCDDMEGYCFKKSSVNNIAANTAFNTTTNSTNITNATKTNTTNTTNTTTNQTTLNKLQGELNSLKISLDSLKSDLSTLQKKVDNQGDQISTIATLNQKLTSMEDFLDKLNLDVQAVGYQQSESKEELSGELHAVSTGLAMMQENLTATQSQLAEVEKEVSNKGSLLNLVIYFVIAIIAAGIAIGTIYYLHKKGTSGEGEQELTPQVHAYLTKLIRQGKKFPQIKEELLRSGWPEKEIHWAYQATIKHNYQRFSGAPAEAGSSTETKTTSTTSNTQKIIALVVVCVLIVGGAFLLMRGVTTGKAIFFQSGTELSTNLRQSLEKNIAANQFYPLVGFGNLCVQVNDGMKSASYRIIKTASGHALREAKLPCDQNSNAYDFSVKFQEWESFKALSSALNCESLKALSKRQVVVLPSRYVLPGFTLNPDKDATKYCAVLKECLNEVEVMATGVEC
ncbi:MAG: hypothetical protein AABY26_05320 [Nanoarchaeota archaeon]